MRVAPWLVTLVVLAGCGAGAEGPGAPATTSTVSVDAMARWSGVEHTLLDLQSLVVDTDREGAMDRFLRLLRRRDEEGLTYDLTEAGTWNHMGSLFDNQPSFDDPADGRRWSALQLELAEELERLGVATSDVHDAADILRQWKADGLF